jgi:hypothetical protein
MARVLYLVALVLLPWGGVFPLPGIHPHAAWGDLVFAATAVAWGLERLRQRQRPHIRPLHVALGLYLAQAALTTWAHAAHVPLAPPKLLGLVELVLLTVLTSELAATPVARRALARVVAVNTGLILVAASAGVLLTLAGVQTPLVGTFGDLLPGPYARAQAGFSHPNLLASYSLFAWGVMGSPDSGLSPRMRRLLATALGLTVVLTFSRTLLVLIVVAAIARADSRRRRRVAACVAALCACLLLSLTLVHLELDPTRPWTMRVAAGPGPRLEAALSALVTLRSRPLLGVGPATPPGLVHGQPFDAHFTPLNVAASLGLPGLVFFGAVWIILWRSRARPTDRALWGALIGMALDGLAQDIEDFRHVWLLFGLADAKRDESV